MFQFPGLSSPKVCVPKGDASASAGGFAHSETRGSSGVCPSPRIIAACRVLRRLHVPRHPPCALDIFPRTARDAVSRHLNVWVSHTAGGLAAPWRSFRPHGPRGGHATYSYIDLQIGRLSLLSIQEESIRSLNRSVCRYAALKVPGVTPGTGRWRGRHERAHLRRNS